MTDNNRPSPPVWVKPALEYGPILGFFIAYMRLRDKSLMIGGTEYDGLVVVTAGFVPLMVVATLILWRLTGRLSVAQIMTTALVVVFGGLTVWLNDPRFIKMKPTMLYLGFGTALLVGLLRGKSWLKPVLGEALPLLDTGWMKLTRRFCVMFFSLAVANELIWRNMSEATWVSFKTFGLPLLLMGFIFANIGLIKAYSPPEEA